MIPVKGFAAQRASSPLSAFAFERRDPGAEDIVIDILFCGVCHTDIHQTRNEWGGSHYPMVPGHEIVGRVSRVGTKVTRFNPGDTAGVGCFVDSDRTCPSCRQGLEQFCDGIVWTYNGTRYAGASVPGTGSNAGASVPGTEFTYGGYSSQIVVDERYALRIPEGLPLERVAPLLCAGITTYSPLRHWKVGKGQKVGVIGLGGLGHMGVKFAVAMGAEVTVFSHSPSKAADAKRLGAAHFVSGNGTRHASASVPGTSTFDFLLDTVSAPHAVTPYLELLRPDGTLVFVGVPPEPLSLETHPLIMRRRRVAGSLIGGIAETQEMLDFCADRKVLADVEVIAMKDIHTAYERMMKGDVRFRFSIDIKTLP